MDWAIVIEGRADAAAVLLLFDDRGEAESIAIEVRSRGLPVAVVPHAGRAHLAIKTSDTKITSSPA